MKLLLAFAQQRYSTWSGRGMRGCAMQSRVKLSTGAEAKDTHTRTLAARRHCRGESRASSSATGPYGKGSIAMASCAAARAYNQAAGVPGQTLRFCAPLPTKVNIC